MVDVIKSLGFEYVAAVPGSSFRSLHESIINYGGNKAPELITCCHEESSVNIAHGYTEIEGKPMLVLVHATVGLQHASMAVYDAWVGRTPVCIMIGNALEFSVGAHASADVAAMVRDFSKWDDNPISFTALLAESTVRAYKYAMTLPRGPVLLSVDSQLQETPIAKDAALHIPKLAFGIPLHRRTPGRLPSWRGFWSRPRTQSLWLGAWRALRREWTSSSNLSKRCRYRCSMMAGISLHIILFNQVKEVAALIQDADLILGLESEGLSWRHPRRPRSTGTHQQSKSSKPGAKVISITTADLYARSNFAALPRYAEVDLAIAADPEVRPFRR